MTPTKTKPQTIIARAARLSALASLAAGSPEDLDDVDGWEASDGEHDALDADMRQALDRRASPDEHKSFAKAYESEIEDCWTEAESRADRHLAAISWTAPEGTSDEALGLAGREAWGAGETGWDEVDQGAWSRLCRMAVRRAAHRKVAASRQCECGAALGETCSGRLGADAVTIEWMPDQHRGSHEAAGSAGSWPDNGALRLRVTPQCARHLEHHDGKWTHRVRPEIGAWTLTIEGEGELPDSLSGSEDEAKAIAWAERLIRRGDYDLAEGETTTVKYHLRRGDVQVDRHVDVEG